MRARALGAVVLCLALLSSCLSVEKERRTGKVPVASDPPGAYITRADAAGKVAVGQAPMEVEYQYEVEKRDFPFAMGWITAVLGWGVTAAGGYVLVDGVGDAIGPCTSCGTTIPVGAVALGLGIGLGATMTAVTVDSYGKVGEKPISDDPVKLIASSEGRQSQELVIDYARPDQPLRFFLPPATEGVAAGGGAFRSNPVVAGKLELRNGQPQPGAYALVIGVEKYRDVPPPPGARADAERFAQLAAITLGIPERNVKVLLDDRATRGDIEKALLWLKTNVPADGRIYFYFAGHGAPDTQSGDPFLVPYDGDPAFLGGTALPVSRIMADLAATKAKEVVAVLDACFSGSGGRSVLPVGTRPLVPVKTVAPAERVAVFAASGPAEITGAAAAGGGLFSSHVIEGLGQARADANADGQITLGELSAYVTPRVTNDARRDGRSQTPSLSQGGNPAELVLAFGVTP